VGFSSVWSDYRLSDAIHCWHCHLDGVFFDAWFPSKALLKRIGGSGWYCVGCLKRSYGCAIRAGRARSDGVI
jgi:hypothetical protein